MRGPDECWPWRGHIGKNGYALITVGKRTALELGLPLHLGHATSTTASRAVYLLLVGPIKPGHEIDHLCRNTICINPRHLEQVTQYENNIGRSNSPAALNARRTHCRAGHRLAGKNLRIVYRRGRAAGRCCLACHRERERRYRRMYPERYKARDHAKYEREKARR